MPLENQDFDDLSKMVGITLNPTKADNSPATLDGPAQAVTQIGDVVATVEGDGTITIVSGTPGAYEVLVSADADLGAGVRTISDVVRGTILGAGAVSLGLTAGTVQPK